MYLIPGSLAISCSSNYCNKDGTFSAFVPIDDACDSNIILTANVCVHAWVCESLEAALGTVLCLDVKTLESFWGVWVTNTHRWGLGKLSAWHYRVAQGWECHHLWSFFFSFTLAFSGFLFPCLSFSFSLFLPLSHSFCFSHSLVSLSFTVTHTHTHTHTCNCIFPSDTWDVLEDKDSSEPKWTVI